MDKIRIVRLVKDNAWVLKDKQIVQVNIKGNLRIGEHKLAVGDYVMLKQEESSLVITDIEKRKNFLTRPKVANIDLLIIIQSIVEPNFNTLLLDKMICYYQAKNIDIKIAISKLDIVDINNKQLVYLNDYRAIGYDIIALNDNVQYHNMIESFKLLAICFVGNSGVGKTTLINRIEPKLDLRVQAISQALNRGKHTTTNISIIPLTNFMLVDTPGYSSIEINLSKQELAHVFFKKELKNEYCKYFDCIHRQEKDCIVKKMVDKQKIFKWRYNNYLLILNDLKDDNDRY